MAGDSGDELYLLCRVRERRCALQLAHVVETLRPLPLRSVPGAPPPVIGASIIRGRPTPVLDSGMLIGEASRPHHSRLATIRCGERIAALAFEEIVGVRRLLDQDVKDMPPLLRAGDGGAIDAIALLDAELVFVLGRARLVPDEVWTSLQAQPA